jgi:hypothetical protein
MRGESAPYEGEEGEQKSEELHDCVVCHFDFVVLLFLIELKEEEVICLCDGVVEEDEG